MYKLGKTPARLDSIKLKYTDYKPTIGAIPASEKPVNLPWEMLGNDNYGDCVWAGAAHETMGWNNEAKKTVTFTDKAVLSDYSKVTGFNPNDPSTDQGTDMVVAASYRKKTGVVDAHGVRHKVGAYVAITPGVVQEVKETIYLFAAVGIGIQFPDYAMDQFDAGQSWHYRTGGKIVGGHYVPAIGYDETYCYVVTWGKVQKMTWKFLRVYMDEGVVYLSQEFLTAGKSKEGFDVPTLTKDLSELT